jgi:hypothetical protein
MGIYCIYIIGGHMARTQLRGVQIGDGSVQRADLDVVNPGQAVITKIVQGSGITLSYTGADPGTGDVTINATAGTRSVDGGSPESVYLSTQKIDGGAP